MEYTAEFLTQLYRNLLSVRLFEEKQVELYALGKVPGHIHSGIGEEGSCTGVFATHKEATISRSATVPWARACWRALRWRPCSPS